MVNVDISYSLRHIETFSPTPKDNIDIFSTYMRHKVCNYFKFYESVVTAVEFQYEINTGILT